MTSWTEIAGIDGGTVLNMDSIDGAASKVVSPSIVDVVIVIDIINTTKKRHDFLVICSVIINNFL